MPDTGPSWLTVTEIARRLGLPSSTVRNWRNNNRNLLEERTDRQGRYTYSLAVFMEIERLHQQGRSVPDVRAALASVPDRTADSWQAELISELRALRIAVERLADHFTLHEGDI